MALLRTLRIRNLVIIEDLTVEFGPGLNLLTGETGAGKSILVDALGLVSGARADRSLVRTGQSHAVVEALFEIDEDSLAAQRLRDTGAAELDEGQLVVRREVAAQGSGRIQLNGSPCTLGMLRDLSEQLLELHGQHDPRSLLDAERHLELLDDFGGHRAETLGVAESYRAVQQARSRLAVLNERVSDRARRLDELRETIREIEELAPRPGELEQLDRERHVLQNAGRVAELLRQVVGMAYENERSASELGAKAAAGAEELAELDPSLAEPAGRMRAAIVELEDAAGSFSAYRDGADFDPARQEAVESRRVELQRAALRHGVDESGLLERLEEARGEMGTLESISEELAQADESVALAERGYVDAALQLGGKRRSAARKLESAVEQQFGALSLGKSRFRVELPAARGEPIEREGHEPLPLGARGAERAEFLLAANPGEPLRALRQVASGGELSRVMLALHVVAEGRQGRRVLVFDEIDSGVGGAVADAVGARLQRLARSRQLLCVTHLPQVAAYADNHFRVRKRVASGRTHAGIVSLSGSERVEELARMLGGKSTTSTSRRHASELLNAAGRRAAPPPGREA